MKKTIVLLCLLVLWTSSVTAQKPQRFHKALPAGNYSSITALGNNRYAVVSDKSEEDGFFILHIEIDSIKGRITALKNEGFRSSDLPNRDIEGICYRPSTNTVFISGEQDNEVYEYTLDGKRTGKRLEMPAFFKDAILKSYEVVGWDLGSSTFEGKEIEFPDFEILAEQLNELIEQSDYASDIKSNYRGALITRVKSLTVGLNKSIFMSDQTPYEKLFDENCILDISRVKSNETKALIMGLMVYMLNEYRVDHKTVNNSGLKHITVLEEAHNLLKATDGHDSELIGKSVEMLTQTIAEIRTYGEGFIIVDQSPSSVDIAAIKNTNTKIVLRTPEARDREAVGKSMGLNEDQLNEIAKLPGGVAVVYQNNWVAPVLTLVNKADIDETPYVNKTDYRDVMTLKEARTNIVKMIMQPWLKGKVIDETTLRTSLKLLDLTRKDRKQLSSLISDYTMFNGILVWKESDMPYLQRMIQNVIGIDDIVYGQIDSADELKVAVSAQLKKVSADDVTEICYVLTSTGGERHDV